MINTPRALICRVIAPLSPTVGLLTPLRRAVKEVLAEGNAQFLSGIVTRKALDLNLDTTGLRAIGCVYRLDVHLSSTYRREYRPATQENHRPWC
jgi:hypothetical protein